MLNIRFSKAHPTRFCLEHLRTYPPRTLSAGSSLKASSKARKRPPTTPQTHLRSHPRAIDHHPRNTAYRGINWRADPDLLTAIKQAFVVEFFEAIGREDNEFIALLIQHNIVTANTTNQSGQTPLLATISTKGFSIVKRLLDFGADPNAFGAEVPLCEDQYSRLFMTSKVDFQGEPLRSPLMLAASMGPLPKSRQTLGASLLCEQRPRWRKTTKLPFA